MNVEVANPGTYDISQLLPMDLFPSINLYVTLRVMQSVQSKFLRKLFLLVIRDYHPFSNESGGTCTVLFQIENFYGYCAKQSEYFETLALAKWCAAYDICIDILILS
jgi:hypothetical protein